MDQMSQYVRPPTQVPRHLWFAVGIAGGLAALLAYQAIQMHAAAAVTEQHGRELLAIQAAKPVPKKSRRVLDEQKRWAALKGERDFAWDRLFAAVEQSVGPDIELLGFDPDKGNQRLLLSGEAHDQKALTIFLDALSAQPSLKNVHLTLQQRKKRERFETVVFEISSRIAE